MSPNDGPATGAISVSGRATSGSGLATNPVLSEWISARTVTLDRFSRDCERRPGHTRGFGLGDQFRSGYFRFRWVQGGGAECRYDNRLASGCNKTRFFHVESADFTENIPNYAKKWKITPYLITDQSTLINDDFATKYATFATCLRGNGNTNLTTGIGNRISPSSSSFQGSYTRQFLHANRSILPEMRLFTCYNCALNQTSGISSTCRRPDFQNY